MIEDREIMNQFLVMFIGAGGPEILIILLVLLLLFGVKDAPRILRKISDIFFKIRNTADEFKHEIMYSDMKSEADEKEKQQNAQYSIEEIDSDLINNQNNPEESLDVEKS